MKDEFVPMPSLHNPDPATAVDARPASDIFRFGASLFKTTPQRALPLNDSEPSVITIPGPPRGSAVVHGTTQRRRQRRPPDGLFL